MQSLSHEKFRVKIAGCKKESPPCRLAKLRQYWIGIGDFYINILKLQTSQVRLSLQI